MIVERCGLPVAFAGERGRPVPGMPGAGDQLQARRAGMADCARPGTERAGRDVRSQGLAQHRARPRLARTRTAARRARFGVSEATADPSRRIGSSQLLDAATLFGVVDEGGEAARFGLLFLGADDPPGRGLAVRRRLRLEERPRLLVGAELAFLGTVEPDSLLFERVLIRARFVALVERALTGRLDASFGSELVEARDVLGAPDAAGACAA